MSVISDIILIHPVNTTKFIDFLLTLLNYQNYFITDLHELKDFDIWNFLDKSHN